MASLAQPSAPQAFRWQDTTSAQRKTVLAAGLGWMLDAFDVMLYSLVLTELIRTFGMSKGTAGLLNSLTLIASAIGSLIFGALADRYGRGKMLSASILTYSVFTFACGLAPTVAVLAVFRFLLGLGMGGEWNTGATLVAETWPSAWRGRAMAMVQCSWAVGYALAAVVAGTMLPITGWRPVFFVGIIPALITFWIRHDIPEPELWRSSLNQPVPRGVWKSIMAPLLILCAMNTFGMFAWWGLFSWIPAYLALPVAEGGRGFQMTGVTGFLVVLNLVGMLPGYLLFGYLADSWGRKRSIVLYLAAAAVMALVFSQAREPWAILVSACLTAFFGTGFFTGSGIIASELFPTSIRAAAVGVSYNAARGLSALAPVVVGSIGESRGLDAAFVSCSIAFALAALSALLVRETRGVELH